VDVCSPLLPHTQSAPARAHRRWTTALGAPAENGMDRLYEIGFQRTGWCRLEVGKLRLELTGLADSRNVLYAFISSTGVKYGGKSTQTLCRGMARLP